MTLEILQKDMMMAMKLGDKERKSVLSMVIAQIKKSAIDKGCRDNIDEAFVDAELLKYKKSVKEAIDTLPTTDPRWDNACTELMIINEYAPQLITSEEDIYAVIRNEYEGPLTKKDLMKFLSANYRGKMDMKVASKCVDELTKR